MTLTNHLPRHIAIVMDGNGRWAIKNGKPRIEGHQAGVAAVKKIVAACLQKGVSTLSLFAFSSENWQRPPEEVNFLMELFLLSLQGEIEALDKQQVRLFFSGDRTILNTALQEQMTIAEQQTQDNSRLLLNIMVNYGGKWDLTQACRSLAIQVMRGELTADDIDEAMLAQQLSSAEFGDPDLFIRTSGEYRISNFYLWQLAYAELYFTDIHWPDFDEIELERALDSYAARERRFGLVKSDCEGQG